MSKHGITLLLSITVHAAAGMAQQSRIFESIVAPARARNQRKSEADMLELRDARLLLVWSEFPSISSLMPIAAVAGRLAYNY